MAQIQVGHFEADGNAVNIQLGFVPDHVKIFNQMAALGENIGAEWFGIDGGDNAGFTIGSMSKDSAGTTTRYNASAAYVSDYDATSVQTSDPIQVTGGQGFIVAASFMDDGDEIWYMAMRADRVRDHGDINS
jgi:hypothetical protein